MSTSLEESISNVISAALAGRYVHPVPIYTNREQAAIALGMSVQSLDRLFEEGVLNSSQHTTQFKRKGRTMYYMPEILKTLQPSKATIKLFGDQGR